MLTVTINCEGKTLTDIEFAIDEAKKHIIKGSRSGMDSNDTGEYDFDVSGEEETIPESVSENEELFIKWCKINHEGHQKKFNQICEVDRMVALYDEKKATLEEVYDAVVETEPGDWEESWTTFLADNHN